MKLTATTQIINLQNESFLEEGELRKFDDYKEFFYRIKINNERFHIKFHLPMVLEEVSYHVRLTLKKKKGNRTKRTVKKNKKIKKK